MSRIQQGDITQLANLFKHRSGLLARCSAEVVNGFSEFLFPEQVNINQLRFAKTSMTVDEQYIRSIVMPLGSDTPVITKTLTSRTIW